MEEWQLALLIILGGTLLLMVLGMPLFAAFTTINMVGVYIFMGGERGFGFLVSSIFETVTMFALIPLVLFILMGEVMYNSGITPNVIGALDKWLGRMPGRLSLLCIGSGTIFATLTADSLAGAALLGSTLEPEMKARGVHKSMRIGPIAAGGCLAAMIPPAALAVLYGAIAKISVGQTLMAIIVPGIILAVCYATYIIVRSILQPELAPAYDVRSVPLSEKLKDTVKYILPAGFVIFMVTGVIFLGICTPTEAAATGAVSAFILTAVYGQFNRENISKSTKNALSIAVMILCIVAGAQAFSQLLAFTGVTRNLMSLITNLGTSPMVTIILMQLIILLMGMFLEVIPIMMITTPIFMPLIKSFGYDPIWYAVIFLINLELSGISPPYALQLFVIKGVVSDDVTMFDIYKSVIPFFLIDLCVMGLLMAFPAIVLWLPNLMQG